MKVKFNCYQCGRVLSVPIQWVTKMVACPYCESPNRVPRPGVPDTDAQPVDDRLGLPPRAAHARYLDELEAAAQSKQSAEVEPAELIVDRRARAWLIAANVLVALAVISVAAYFFVPWSKVAAMFDPPAVNAPTESDGAAPVDP